MVPPFGASAWATSCGWLVALVLLGWLTGGSEAKGSTGTAGNSVYTTTYYGGGSGLPSAPFSPNTIDDGDDNGYIIPLIMGVFGGGFLLVSLCIAVGMMHSSNKEGHDFQAGYPPSSLYVYGDQGLKGYSGEDSTDTDHDTEGPLYQDGMTSHHVQPAQE